MGTRIELQSLLEKMLGSRNVYYQPPATVRMKYPAIVYFRKRIENSHANDGVYRQDHSYELTVISQDPEESVVEDISKLPLCSYDRRYVADNLNHDVFTLYY